MEPDTYFFSPEEALRVAKEQNRSEGPNKYLLQLCYYNGEKIDSDLVNLIHMPIENIVDSLGQGRYRIPTKVDFHGLDLSADVQMQITQNLTLALSQAREFRKELNKFYLQRSKNAKLDFKEPLRFYLIGHVATRVMQYVSANIVAVLQEQGYKVFFDLMYGIEDPESLKNFFEFNPHITININHLNNHYLSPDVFNFVWFQDAMPILTNNDAIKLRKRDSIFHLTSFLQNFLKNKGIKSFYQPFCVNELLYRQRNEIKKEKKIVFIGSSYLNTMPYSQTMVEATKELKHLFLTGVEFDKKLTKKIAKKYDLSVTFVEMKFIPYIIRDMGVLELSKIKSDFTFELYGWGWEVYEELLPYYKGVLEYGDEIAKVYNSATFAFAPHHHYTLQQRTLEAAACGAIPIVYDCRNISNEESYEEALHYYKSIEDLKKILNTDMVEKDFSKLLQNHTYKSFIQKILKIIDEKK